MNTENQIETDSGKAPSVESDIDRVQWWMNDGEHFFNGDRLEVAKRELEDRRATIYHRLASGQIETLFVKIIECKPDSIRCRWHDWSAGVTREHDLKGADIENWILATNKG